MKSTILTTLLPLTHALRPSTKIDVDTNLLKSLKNQDPYNVWIAFNRQGQRHFFNPSTNKLLNKLPSDSLKIIESIGGASGLVQENVTYHEKKIRKFKHGDVVAADADDDWSGDCAPKCQWQCTNIECEKNCEPKCTAPSCQTRCKNPDMAKCQLACPNTPKCSMYCPPQHACKASANGTKACVKPDCAVKCHAPQCVMECGTGGVDCHNVCGEPKCDWHCKDPKTCPLPQCKLRCEKAKCRDSVTSFDLPEPAEDETIMNHFQAVESYWLMKEWSKCDCKTGKHYREIRCKDELTFCGTVPPPSTTKPCGPEIECAPSWNIGEWGHCRGECFARGAQYRNVTCANDRCEHATPPPSLRECEYKSEHCDMCQATLHGNGFFGGWAKTLKASDDVYSRVHLSARDIDIENAHSLDVEGHCCFAKMFAHPDGGAGEWSAIFGEGQHQESDLVQHGWKTKEANSIKIFKDHVCIANVRRHSNANVMGVFSALAVGLVGFLFA